MQPSSPKLFPSLWRITNKLNSSPGSRVHFQSLADFIALFIASMEALGESVYYFFFNFECWHFPFIIIEFSKWDDVLSVPECGLLWSGG